MDPKDLPKNSMMLRMDILDSGDLKIYTAQHFGDDLTEEQCVYYMNVLTGLNYVLNFGTEFAVNLGELVDYTGELEAEEEFVFEPADELLQAISDAKIVPFDKKKLN
jgi:uncharacterized protein YlaN (UPF0358 family)|tara:strand:+ start:1036 stop:1356 length:321 start_codon:yes stop_codon:yes gene_type:complete